MNRKEYYSEHRARRIAAKEARGGLSASSLTAMLKEYYTFILSEKDRIKYDLICRYEEKVSPQLKFDKKKLREKGKASGETMIRDLVFRENPLLKLIPKDTFQGCYLPVPLSYGASF